MIGREVAIAEPCPICNGSSSWAHSFHLEAARRQANRGGIVVLSAICKSCGRRFRKQTGIPEDGIAGPVRLAGAAASTQTHRSWRFLSSVPTARARSTSSTGQDRCGGDVVGLVPVPDSCNAEWVTRTSRRWSRGYFQNTPIMVTSTATTSLGIHALVGRLGEEPRAEDGVMAVKATH